MQTVIAGALLVVAFIHALPLIGLLSKVRVERLYDVTLSDPNVVVLLRHRAALFGVVAFTSTVGAFIPAATDMAIGIGTVSVVSFLVIARLEGPVNAALARVARVDLVALVALVVAGVARFFA